MKIPRRPFYPLPPDIFGLKRPGILNLESEVETRERIATIEKGVETAFKASIDHLGEEEARRLFARVLRRPKRGRGKILALDRDSRLLKEYAAAAPKGESIANGNPRRAAWPSFGVEGREIAAGLFLARHSWLYRSNPFIAIAAQTAVDQMREPWLPVRTG